MSVNVKLSEMLISDVMSVGCDGVLICVFENKT